MNVNNANRTATRTREQALGTFSVTMKFYRTISLLYIVLALSLLLGNCNISGRHGFEK